jgi:hypothetical protein
LEQTTILQRALQIIKTKEVPMDPNHMEIITIIQDAELINLDSLSTQ